MNKPIQKNTKSSDDPRDARLDELFSAARQGAPGSHPREFGFENRLMARIDEDQGDAAAPPVFWQRLAPLAPAITGVLTVSAGVWGFGQLRDFQDLLVFTQEALMFGGVLL
jgi:hypothetical protein